MRLTSYSQKVKEHSVKCLACSNCCNLQLSQKGACGAYQNINGKLYSLLYGLVSQRVIDKTKNEVVIASLGDTNPLLRRFSKKISFCLTDASVKIPALLEVYPFELLRICKSEGLKRIIFDGSDPACCIDFIVDIAKEARRKDIMVVVKTTDQLSDIVRKRVNHLNNLSL
ncbi:hypothetical protein JW962_00840 [Candidatus Dojkabacteria bacterium]|nr:hypothetical protein [Candidatus Dojkabacteria bacterium]